MKSEFKMVVLIVEWS